MEDCEAAVQGAEWERAVASCRSALEERPDSFGIRYFLGYAHQALGHWTEAAAAFEDFVAAVEGEPGVGERMQDQVAVAVRSAGLAHARAGDHPSADPWLRQAADADPQDPEVAFWLGYGLQDREPGEAEAAFRIVVQRAPEITEAVFLLGRLRYRAGGYDEAGSLLARYLDADPNGAFAGEAHWMAALTALRQEAGSEQAAAHFTAFLESGGDGSRAAAAHHFLGDRAANAKDCAAAIRHYRRFVELVPDDPRVPEVAGYLEAAARTCEPAVPDRTPERAGGR